MKTTYQTYLFNNIAEYQIYIKVGKIKNKLTYSYLLGEVVLKKCLHFLIYPTAINICTTLCYSENGKKGRVI